MQLTATFDKLDYFDFLQTWKKLKLEMLYFIVNLCKLKRYIFCKIILCLVCSRLFQRIDEFAEQESKRSQIISI